MKIDSLELQVNQLIRDVAESKSLEINDLLKSKIAMQLSKVHFGLKMVDRLIKLYDYQELVEDRLFDQTEIENLSVRELLVMQSVVGKRIDNYSSKIDSILAKINLRELEGSLTLISNTSSTKEITEDDKDLRNKSLEVLSLVGKLTNKQNSRGKDSTDMFDDISEAEIVPVEKLDNTDEVLRKIDRVGEINDNE
ncbi:hypothetical protein [Yersinia phage vB_Yru_GN1]|uniref:Uncharacterized protein n=1 Tax=Yersinia phage vB_Yru_GN1 TaxID=3074381 RepID=A0AA86J444_9CAUD|nr:hypothetical protein [Yersinia phage vB_Yru_GN1]